MTSNRNRAVAAAMGAAAALGLTVDDAIVLQESNRLAVRLMPCDVLARVAEERIKRQAEFEVELALRLAETGSPLAALEPRVAPGVYVRDGFVVTLWTYYEPVPSREFAPADYAHALERLHDCMRQIDFPTPHFTDRITDAQRLIGSRDQTPELVDADRELLSNTLRSLRQAISARGRPEQLLHGEPHPGNVLRTKKGLLFIDLETLLPRARRVRSRLRARRGERALPEHRSTAAPRMPGPDACDGRSMALGSKRPIPQRATSSARIRQRAPGGTVGRTLLDALAALD